MTAQPAFSGVWCPSVTPFDNQGKVDIEGLGRHFSRLTASGIDTLLLMGSIGEFASLTQKERLLLLSEARSLSSLSMVANVSSTCIPDMIELAEAAWKNGFDAVMVLPPYYYGQTQNQLLSYFRALDKQLGGKWFAYNFPARTGCDLSPALISQLAAELPDFIGVKDTIDCLSHNRALIEETKKVRSDFAVLSGYDEYLMPNLLAGGAGVISGLNNIVPELFAAAMQAWRAGNVAELTRIQQKIGKLMAIYTIGDDFVTTIKTAVSRRFDSMTSQSRNYGGTLTTEQCAAIDQLFDE